jgi:hypothetical protein
MSKPEKPLESGHTPRADFDRNREGLYGGLPRVRDPKEPASAPKAPDKETH